MVRNDPASDSEGKENDIVIPPSGTVTVAVEGKSEREYIIIMEI